MFSRPFAESVRMARFGLLIISIMVIGRWILSLTGVPYYPRGTAIFSIVLATTFLNLTYGAFLRSAYGYRLVETFTVVCIIVLYAQLLVILSTFLSFGLGIETYFNYPDAVTGGQGAITAGDAIGPRFGGLVINTIIAIIECMLGYWFGGLLPKRAEA